MQLFAEDDLRLGRKHGLHTTYVRLPAAMFDLMGLPAEIRIKIYEYALVRDVIRIVMTLHPFGTVHPSTLEEVQWCYEEPNPKKSVTLRSRRIILENIKFVAGEVVGDEVSESYGIQPNNSPPVVNLFLTSRKVYSETWPIFYQQNAFAFATPQRSFYDAQNCIQFLYDRPYHALRHIRELHLLIGDAPQHPIRHDLNSRPWKRLLDEISRNMSLRVLVLYIRGRTDDAPRLSKPNLPCKELLFQITGLQELHMDIIGESTHEEHINFVKHLRSKMVVGGEQMGTEDFVLGEREIPCLKWTIGDPCNSLLTTSKYPDMEENFCSS